MVCGGDHNLDTCQGDSGGPLIANIDGKFTLVGVTSWVNVQTSQSTLLHSL